VSDLLEPGQHRSDRLDDAALWLAMGRVEVSWMRALVAHGIAGPRHLLAVTDAVQGLALPDDASVEAAGNPAVALVDALRSGLDEEPAGLVHRGLTSQDVVDTALMLLAGSALDQIQGSLGAVEQALAALAVLHRDTVMAGRTLTQYAVPVTFGLKAAQWLEGVLDAHESLAATRAALPAQAGGAAGTLSLLSETTTHPLAVVDTFVADLGLAPAALPWHTRRTPITRLAAALCETTNALGVIAGNVSLLGRPELGEVREGAQAGRGGSSTMPHKRNPVLTVLVRSAALQAPHLLAELNTASALAVDERPDGAWHAEWPTLRRLLVLTVTTADQAAELVAGLDVDPDEMARRADRAADDLLAEAPRATGDPRQYVGQAGVFVDRVLARWDQTRG
jgi:3-carboxy-cis,cis-muconate cycloisomerase